MNASASSGKRLCVLGFAELKAAEASRSAAMQAKRRLLKLLSRRDLRPAPAIEGWQKATAPSEPLESKVPPCWEPSIR